MRFELSTVDASWVTHPFLFIFSFLHTISHSHVNTYFGVSFSEFNQHGLTQSPEGFCWDVQCSTQAHVAEYSVPSWWCCLGTVDASGHGTQLANTGAFVSLRTG